MSNSIHFNINKQDKGELSMTDVEKEIYIEGLKRQVRSQHNPDVADKLCKRLDEAKKEADLCGHLYNTRQLSLQQIIQTLMHNY